MPSCETSRPTVTVEGTSLKKRVELSSSTAPSEDTPRTDEYDQQSVIDDAKDSSAETSDTASTDDDERNASKILNPGAKEFLPVSPGRSPPQQMVPQVPFVGMHGMQGMPNPVWYGPPNYGYPGYCSPPFSPDKHSSLVDVQQNMSMVPPDNMPPFIGYGMPPPMPWMTGMPFHGPMPHSMGQDNRMGMDGRGDMDRSLERPEDLSRQDDGPFKLDVEKVKAQLDTRTTIMVKNIPNKYTQRNLLELIDRHHEGTYDFFYLPIDFKNKCNLGYAFINFTHPVHIVAFFMEFANKRWGRFNSDKVCELSYARIQSKGALVAHFRNSRLMFKHEKYRPLVFGHDGAGSSKPAPFPAGPGGVQQGRRGRGGNGVPNGVPIVLVNTGIPVGMTNGMLATAAPLHAMQGPGGILSSNNTIPVPVMTPGMPTTGSNTIIDGPTSEPTHTVRPQPSSAVTARGA